MDDGDAEANNDDVFAALLAEESRGAWRAGEPPCRLARDGVLGRHVVATRPVAAGELLLRCEPLVVGPKATGVPVCLGCFRRLGAEAARAARAAWTACGGCGWPLCSERCRGSPLHRDECALLGAARGEASEAGQGVPRVPPPHMYAGLLPLRCLRLQGRRGRAVRALQSHLAERVRGAAPYRLPDGLQRRAAAFVRVVLGDALGDVEREALRMAAVLDTNAFDVSRDDGTEARALFGAVSMLSHDCRANARCAMLGLGPGLELGVLAQRAVAPGDVVSVCYLGDAPLSGALQRRRHLRDTKCFDCGCARCRDPADLGLRLDSVRCVRCRARGGAPSLLESSSPLDGDADWRCPRCGFALSADQMALGHRRLRSQVSALGLGDRVVADGAAGRAEAFLDEHLGPDGLLHATSAHVLRVKQGLLSSVYAHIPGCTPPPDVDDAALARGVAMCGELLDAVAVLEPGLGALRGALLLRLHGLLLERARRGGRGAAARDDVETSWRLFGEADAIFMDLETRAELQKRRKATEKWIHDNITMA